MSTYLPSIFTLLNQFKQLQDKFNIKVEIDNQNDKIRTKKEAEYDATCTQVQSLDLSLLNLKGEVELVKALFSP